MNKSLPPILFLVLISIFGCVNPFHLEPPVSNIVPDPDNTILYLNRADDYEGEGPAIQYRITRQGEFMITRKEYAWTRDFDQIVYQQHGVSKLSPVEVNDLFEFVKSEKFIGYKDNYNDPPQPSSYERMAIRIDGSFKIVRGFTENFPEELRTFRSQLIEKMEEMKYSCSTNADCYHLNTNRERRLICANTQCLIDPNPIQKDFPDNENDANFTLKSCNIQQNNVVRVHLENDGPIITGKFSYTFNFKDGNTKRIEETPLLLRNVKTITTNEIQRPPDKEIESVDVLNERYPYHNPKQIECNPT